MTKEEAKKLIGTEVECSECDAVYTVRKRSLNATMARQLIALYRYFKDPDSFRNPSISLKDDVGEWVHANRYLTGLSMQGECAKLRFWGLLEERSGNKTDGNPHSGYFRITPYGVQFVEGKQAAWKFMLTRNRDGCLGLIEDQTITIQQALGNEFNYAKEVHGAES